MSKQLIVIGIGIVVIVGGAFAYLAMNNDGDEQSSQDSNTEQSMDNENGAPTFNPESTADSAYVATVTGSDESGEVEGTIESDGEGNFRYNFTSDGQASELIITSEGTFSCTSGQGCIRFPSNDDGESTTFQTALNPDRFTYNDEEFQEFQDLASYQGQQTCSIGTCDVWVYSDEETDATIFIESGNKRVVRIESTENTSNFVIEYDYQDVTITAPEDYEEIPSVQGGIQ